MSIYREVVELQAGTYLPKSSRFFSDKTQVKTVAATEAGAHFLMCVIMTIEITAVYEGAKRENIQFVIMWSYFYMNHLVCIVSSIFLYITVSKMDIRRLKKYIKFAVTIYIIWLLVNVGQMVVIEAPHSLVSTLVAALALYKFLSFIIVYFFRKRWKELLRSHSQLSDTDIEAFENGNANPQPEFPGESFHSFPYNKAYEIPFENLSWESTVLGEGEFGQVLKGTLKTNSTQEILTVAVKTTNSNADGCYFRSLLSELKILTCLGQHDHIVNLIGACTSELKQRKIYIVVEFCAHGSIDNYFLARRGFFRNMIVDDQIILTKSLCDNNYLNLSESLTTMDLLKWAYQTSCGMEYLASKRIIHGDIAARNILLTANRSIKIADFGLSRYLYNKLTYIKKQQDPLPWRWMSLESLCSREFSTKSDVWSYAVTLWEFFTLAEIPFQEFIWSEEFVDLVKCGYRLRRPNFCTSSIYQLMCLCWELEPNRRPGFRDISEYFAKVINSVKPMSSYCYTTRL